MIFEGTKKSVFFGLGLTRAGFGRYDIMLESKDLGAADATILEFKVINHRRESSRDGT